MQYFALFIATLVVLSADAKKALCEQCQADDYLVSSLSIFGREARVSKDRGANYLRRIFCDNKSAANIKPNFLVLIQCLRDNGCFDVGALQGHTEQNTVQLVYLISKYDFCISDRFLYEYFDLVTCSQNADWLEIFKKGSICEAATHEALKVEKAIDALGICEGKNRQFACTFDAYLGQHCPKIRDAFIKFASLHKYADEVQELMFLIEVAELLGYPFPSHEECNRKKSLMSQTREALRPYMTWTSFFLYVLFWVAWAVLILWCRRNWDTVIDIKDTLFH